MPKPDLTPAEKLRLLERPYLRAFEIREILGATRYSTEKVIKESGIKQYRPLGYLTDDVIAVFDLEGAIKRWKSA